MPPAAWYGPHGTALEFSAAPSASQLLWDALLLVACGEEAQERGLDARFLHDFSRRCLRTATWS